MDKLLYERDFKTPRWPGDDEGLTMCVMAGLFISTLVTALLSRPRLAASIALVALLSSCAGGPPPSSIAAGPPFAAERFFAGRLDGTGMLRIALHAPSTTHVTSIGKVAPDGTLTLDQHIEQQGKPARDRQWRIRPLGNGRYTGTLTDATGPVTGEAVGNRLHLRFSMKGGMRVDQWLTLSPDARVAQNRMIVRKLGVTVATLDETIRTVP